MGKSWPWTDDQTKYLHSHFAAYLEARQNKTVEAFCAHLYEGWAQHWLEHQVVFPLWKEGNPPLTKDQMKDLGGAIAQQKRVSLAFCFLQNLDTQAFPISNCMVMCDGIVQPNLFAPKTHVPCLPATFKRTIKGGRNPPASEQFSRSTVTSITTRSFVTRLRRK